MANIRVRFVAGPGFVGWYIRSWTGSLFQHTEFGTPEGTWIGAHIGGGIMERPANYANNTREYMYSIPCTQAQADQLYGWARSQIGTKYNVADIVGLMLQKRTLTKAHEYICSQFVSDGLLMVFGPKKFMNVLSSWTYRITPETCHLSPLFAGNLVKKVG